MDHWYPLQGLTQKEALLHASSIQPQGNTWYRTQAESCMKTWTGHLEKPRSETWKIAETIETYQAEQRESLEGRDDAQRHGDLQGKPSVSMVLWYWVSAGTHNPISERKSCSSKPQSTGIQIIQSLAVSGNHPCTEASSLPSTSCLKLLNLNSTVTMKFPC